LAPAAAEASTVTQSDHGASSQPYFLSANLVVSAIVIAMVAERATFQLTKYR